MILKTLYVESHQCHPQANKNDLADYCRMIYANISN